MDWSEKNLCIKCNEGGNLLICSENGCPLALHEVCMRCPVRFDDAGRFYCPYCLYKRAVAESRKAREYALERKKALLMFMDQDITGTEKCSDENNRAEAIKHHQSTHLDEEGHKINGAEEEKVEEEDSEASASSESQDPPVEVHKERNITDEDEKTVQEASSGQDPSDKMHEHETDNAKDEENILEVEYEASSTSTSQDRSPTLHDRAMRGSKRSEPTNSDSETVLGSSKRVIRRLAINSDSDTVSVPGKPVKSGEHNKRTSSNVSSPRRSSRRKSPSASRTEKMSNKRVGVSVRLKQAQKPPIVLSNEVFSSGKRKRLLWTEEEEEKLKEGVKTYSMKGNKNLPWRKILEFGGDVFDKTRTPSDLKDKWRNMVR